MKKQLGYIQIDGKHISKGLLCERVISNLLTGKQLQK